MATSAQLAANIANAQSSTGPTTEEGKSASSQNAVTTGLFTAGALIRPGEELLYAELEQSLQIELSPATLMEENLVEEILGAMWRLRRCRLIESSLAGLDDDTADHRQSSIDRARSQASRLLYRATAELRRLQTERHYRNETVPEGTDLSDLGICDFEKIIRAADRAFERERRRNRKGIEDYFTPIPCPDFTKRTQSPPPPIPETARNAPCPCGSGQKFKRCCGENAPPILHAA
ncbi:MAG TPA: SEC-C metal-binding domain-containing protein [Bryobacteraceae bacterium]|nr:SEC-C metal-binding domain-containing protein [Bryobacteraceae bacterium]